MACVVGVVVPVPVLSRSGDEDDELDDAAEAEEEDAEEEVLRERGRVGRRWWCMRWEAVGQRGRVEVGGEEVGGVRVPMLLLLPLRERLLKLEGDPDPRAGW
jgi:hypothetical protein